MAGVLPHLALKEILNVLTSNPRSLTGTDTPPFPFERAASMFETLSSSRSLSRS